MEAEVGAPYPKSTSASESDDVESPREIRLRARSSGRAPASKSIVCGVVALCLSWIPLLGITGAGAGVIGIVFGVLALRDPDQRQRRAGLLGIVLSLVAMVVSVLVILAVLAYFGWALRR